MDGGVTVLLTWLLVLPFLLLGLALLTTFVTWIACETVDRFQRREARTAVKART